MKMYALIESVTLSKIKKSGCTLLLFEILLSLVAFPSLRGQISDRTVFPDDPDLMPSENRNVCSTPECIDTASRVLSYMNASLDPCDNFYNFACGKFINTNLIHRVNSEDHIPLIKNNIFQEMMNYLQNETLPTLPRYARLIKTFYRSCIDDYENYQWEKFGSQTEYRNILHESFIYISAFYLTADMNNITVNLNIQQPEEFITSRELYNNLLTLGQLFGIEKNDVENSLKQMLEVNNKLQEIYEPESNEDNSFKKITVNELVQKYPNISWKEFFNMSLKPNEINDDDVIYVDQISYFEKFNKLIPTISKRDQANYLMWRAIYQMSESYFDSINTEKYPFKICYTSTIQNFNEAWKFLYVKNHFNNDSFPKDVDEMIHNIHEEYNVTILKNSSWLDNETKLKALEKLRFMIVETPSLYFFYDKEIDEYYENLEITPGDYFQSLSNVTEFNRKDTPNVDPIRGTGNKKSWKQLQPATYATAGYERTQNLIFLIPGFFQGVFYDEERPKYMNYGSMGSIIAREISHAFDSEGRNYDKKGQRVNWWSPEANATFLRKVQCIINQHNHYRVEEVDLNMNGYQTQSENIADYVGNKVAYSAYEKYIETHGLEPLLPRVNYTQRQLFWISYAQKECKSMTEEDFMYIAKNDPHSFPEVRVIGALSNNLKFAEDFQCAFNTKMNPQDKCAVW